VAPIGNSWGPVEYIGNIIGNTIENLVGISKSPPPNHNSSRLQRYKKTGPYVGILGLKLLWKFHFMLQVVLLLAAHDSTL